MNKRIGLALCLLLLLACVFLPGCQAQEVLAPNQPDNIYFYYMRQPLGYGEENGVIGAQSVDLRGWDVDYLQLMRLYLNEPTEAGLRMPIPGDVSVLSVTVDNGVATVTMSRNFSQLSGYNLTIAACCITKTLCQFEDIQTVRLRAQNAQLAGDEYLELSEDSAVLTDSGIDEAVRVSLYFGDAGSRYLLEVMEQVDDVEEAELPAYLVQRLIDGLGINEMQPVLPEGTMLLDASVEDGTCTVDFSADFLLNMPETWQQERISIFSVVNTLTSLEQIDQVRILVDGDPVERYLYMDLSQPLRADASVIGPVRQGLGEFDATLCVPLEGYKRLFACPTRLLGSTTEDNAQIVLEALLDYQGTNGHYNLLPAGININSFSLTGGICSVDLSDDPLKNCRNDDEMFRCLQSMVLSIGETTSVNRMQISVNGKPLVDMYRLDTMYLMPQKNYLQY